MTVQSEATRLDLDAVLAMSEANDEPDWLRDLRRSWWERAEATPWPTGQEEEWRRTSLDRLPRDVDLLLDPPRIETALDSQLAAAGVVFADLRDAVREHPDLVRRAFTEAETTGDAALQDADRPLQSVGSGEWGPGVAEFDSHDKFWALAHAAWSGGTFLYVPSDVAVDEALLARSVIDRGNVAYFPLTLVLAERGARVTLLDEHRSPDGAPVWFGGVVDIRSGRESYVRYANLQRLGDATWNIGAQRVQVGPGADVTTLNAEIGSAVTKVGLDVR
ncbi:MAG TPA: SufD family Fe-S cluster assembly protein, partial [Candidatus Limnocylindrales bacterium]|nr:SufD family Fe-S cluster assembly protein [Candidatus Limnocylindrales bacterium]